MQQKSDIYWILDIPLSRGVSRFAGRGVLMLVTSYWMLMIGSRAIGAIALHYYFSANLGILEPQATARLNWAYSSGVIEGASLTD